MKKSIIIIFLFFLLFVPINVFGLELSTSDNVINIKGLNTILEGEEITLEFWISLSGLSKNYKGGLGISGVTFELVYDESNLTFVSVNSSNWDTSLEEENGDKYIVSVVNENTNNKCIDKINFCGSQYVTTVKFFVNYTAKESIDIKMTNVSAIMATILEEDQEYTEDDFFLVMNPRSYTHKINIEHITDKETTPPVNTTPEVNGESSKQETVVTKSSNKYLKSLTVESYEISFDKNKNDYEITVDKGVNNLNIKLELEDSKATYKIIGADDLKGNNYKVQVEVTAENDEKNTYTINVKEKTEEEIVPEDNTPTKKEKKFKLEKKHFIIGGIIAGVILLIVIIIKLIIHRKDRKLERALDEL